MSRRNLAGIAPLVAGFVVAVLAGAARADTYKVDPVHSSIMFKSKHLNTSYVFGRFDTFEGSINEDSSDPSKTTLEVTAKVDSLNTGNAKRDAHLKSPDFFSANEFPTITFKSTSAKSSGDNKLEVTGDVTLHGQTKPVTVTIEKVGSSQNPPPFGQRVGYFGTFTVKRSDFGMNKMIPMVGDEVELMVALEAQKQ